MSGWQDASSGSRSGRSPTGSRMAPRLDHALIVRPSRPQQRLTLRLDADLVAGLKAQGQGYQARMNAVLRAYVERARKPMPY